MIKTVGVMKEVLNNYNAGDWAKSNAIEKNNSLNFDSIKKAELPENGNVKEKTFGEFLYDSLVKVNNLQQDANTAIERLATGQSSNLHETMIMVEQAEIAFKTMNQIRMKVLDAYKDIMKMQI